MLGKQTPFLILRPGLKLCFLTKLILRLCWKMKAFYTQTGLGFTHYSFQPSQTVTVPFHSIGHRYLQSITCLPTYPPSPSHPLYIIVSIILPFTLTSPEWSSCPTTLTWRMIQVCNHDSIFLSHLVPPPVSRPWFLHHFLLILSISRTMWGLFAKTFFLYTTNVSMSQFYSQLQTHLQLK